MEEATKKKRTLIQSSMSQFSISKQIPHKLDNYLTDVIKLRKEKQWKT